MKKTLFLSALFLAFNVHAEKVSEKVRIFDEVCVAKQISACIQALTGCDSGHEMLLSKQSVSRTLETDKCGTPEVADDIRKLQMMLLSCQVTGRSTKALSAKCEREIDIPSADQINILTKSFNDNFIKALEKSFPQSPAPVPAK